MRWGPERFTERAKSSFWWNLFIGQGYFRQNDISVFQWIYSSQNAKVLILLTSNNQYNEDIVMLTFVIRWRHSVVTVKATLATDFTLQWRHNERNCDPNHRRLDCLLNRMFWRKPKKTSMLRVTGICVGNSPENSFSKTTIHVWYRGLLKNFLFNRSVAINNAR